MRGLSTIIIIILFLMIAIALSALSYTFFVGAFQTVTKSGEQAISKATTSGQALKKIKPSITEDMFAKYQKVVEELKKTKMEEVKYIG